jgi:dihydrofolate reductase
MSATYTFDVFASLDGFGAAGGDWTGYWGKQGPELLEHRFRTYRADQRMVLGGTTYREFNEMRAAGDRFPESLDPWVTRMAQLPTTVVSSTLTPAEVGADVTVLSGDAVDVVSRLKAESPLPLRSHGSLSLNRALLAASLIDVVQVTVFPVVTGRHGINPVFGDAGDFDLDLLDQRLLDGRTLELLYRPTPH